MATRWSFYLALQGSILSPIFFDIYFKDIVNHLHSEPNILLYADDIVVYSTANNIHSAYNSVQNTLDRIAGYLRKRGLDLSPEKSQWMIFIRSRTLPILPSLKISGCSVPRVNVARFLGIILDSRISDENQFQHLIYKGSVLVDIFTSLLSTWWDSHSHLLLNLYRSIFRGSIEYGCQIFQFHKTKSIFIKLERLQFRVIRVAMRYRISTPINVMLFEAREVQT